MTTKNKIDWTKTADNLNKGGNSFMKMGCGMLLLLIIIIILFSLF